MTRDDEIVAENIEAMGGIYFAWQLEQLALFQVADRLIELWSAGVLPVGGGEGRSVFEGYRRGAPRRLSEQGRVALYARCFGVPGGDPAEEPNRQFDELLLRFVRSVSAYARQQSVRRDAPLQKARRDLAVNLSLHGFGTASASGSLQRQIAQALRLLRTGAVQCAYGSREVWDVLERVALIEVGGRCDSVRYQTRARAGGTLLRWLALHPGRRVSTRSHVLDARALRGRKSPTPLETPTDRDLVDACDGWREVSGLDDAQVNEGAQSAEVQRPDARTLRVVRPAVRRLLDSSRAFAQLPDEQRRPFARDMLKVSGYLAQPHGVAEPDFPRFVADLIKGVFDAIVDASIKQMQAYAQLVAHAAKTVDCFLKDAITNGAARRWLCSRHPQLVALTFTDHRSGRLILVARDRPTALRRLAVDLGLPRPANLDDPEQELALVRCARERIARDRQQLLATMVLVGVSRARQPTST